MNKVGKKSIVHQRPGEGTTNKHPEQVPFRLDFLIIGDFRWIHVHEDARARFVGNVLGCLFRVCGGLSRHIVQLC